MGGLDRFTKLMMVTVFAVSRVPKISNGLDKVDSLIDSIKADVEYLKTTALAAGVHPDTIIRECHSSLPQDLQGAIYK